MSFKDHFSAAAAGYVRFRPGYPAGLFAWLASLAPDRGLAWDCGTGSGQAAAGLSAHFERVVASDPSRQQLARAEPRPNVEYRLAAAEASGLEAASVDLLTVAQALHWFDLERFYAEARRVLKPGGVIAAWTYTLLEASHGIGALLDDFHKNVVGPFWPPERRMVEDGYRSLPFPFEPIAAPPFEIRCEWTRDDLLGYLGTWSATRAYAREKGIDPLEDFARRLETLWPQAGAKRALRWPLHLRVGRAVDGIGPQHAQGKGS